MIFHIGKTNLRISFSFIALIVLMILLCEESIVLYSLISSIIHECGHLFFMYFTGDIPLRVDLTLFGMRIDKCNNVHISYKNEFLIALGGIIFNSAVALFCLIVYYKFRSPHLIYVSVINFVIAAVNMFPVSVLDFGRAVRFALLLSCEKEKGEKIADVISLSFVIIFVLFSVFYFIFVKINISLLAVNLYLIFITIIKKWS